MSASDVVLLLVLAHTTGVITIARAGWTFRRWYVRRLAWLLGLTNEVTADAIDDIALRLRAQRRQDWEREDEARPYRVLLSHSMASWMG